MDAQAADADTHDSWDSQNLGGIHFLLAEEAVMSSLAAFGTRVTRGTWGISLRLLRQGHKGLLEVGRLLLFVPDLLRASQHL